MTNQEMFNQKLNEVGFDTMPKGILLIRWKKRRIIRIYQ